VLHVLYARDASFQSVNQRKDSLCVLLNINTNVYVLQISLLTLILAITKSMKLEKPVPLEIVHTI